MRFARTQYYTIAVVMQLTIFGGLLLLPVSVIIQYATGYQLPVDSWIEKLNTAMERRSEAVE